MAAYYNENDPFAAGWLRELITDGLITPGEVDERSIEDVIADDLRGFTQCHFFAGIGVWSHALRLSQWSDDRMVWTGSCPCQPFSAAGKRGGTADERHLWPAFFRLIDQCRPPVVFGEQVASKDGLAWLNSVQIDLEGAGYAFGAVDTCAAGFGAPHIRQRLWFVGLADTGSENEGRRRIFGPGQGNGQGTGAACERPSRLRTDGGLEYQQGDGWLEGWSESGGRSAAGGCGIERVAESLRSGAEYQPREGVGTQAAVDCSDWGIPGQRLRAGVESSSEQRPGPLNGFWRDADWLLCRDGRWRPVKPGTFPLVNGIANRVGLLRGAGNAIVAEQAQGFIEAVMDALSNN